MIRQDLKLSPGSTLSKNFADLSSDARDELEDALESNVSGSSFFQRENPFVRHVVLRKRTTRLPHRPIPTRLFA